MDVTLSAVIGYCFESVMVGVIAEVVLGAANYELVSVRWLKIDPQTGN